jgi:hypothetical protein
MSASGKNGANASNAAPSAASDIGRSSQDGISESPAQNAIVQSRRLRGLITTAILEAASGCADLFARLDAETGWAAVIQAPSSGWVAPIQAEVERRKIKVVVPDTRSFRKVPEHEERERSIACDLSIGRTVVGVAANLEELPRTLLAAADTRIVVRPPDAALMKRLIKIVSGSDEPTTLEDRDLAGLDYSDLVAAFRPDFEPNAIAERLARAAHSRSVISVGDKALTLDKLRGCGPALDWARDLVADIRAVCAGCLQPTALESGIFYGRPGTGKTTLAKLIAREAAVPIFTTNVAEWLGTGPGYLDSVIKEQSRFFSDLRSAGCCVGFLDELDALPNRATLSSRNADWWMPIIIGMLLQTDMIRQSHPEVVLLAATNHIENVDAALRRPGRFDRSFEIPTPDADGLAGILRAHLKDELADADLIPVAYGLLGGTGADVVLAIKGARRRARLAGRPLTHSDLLAEVDANDMRSPEVKRACAIHEAGHAVAAIALGVDVESVSIRMGCGTGGTTSVISLNPIPTREDLERDIIVGLAGRAADEVMGAGCNVGAIGDLAKSTHVLAAIHASYGLGMTLTHRIGSDQAAVLLGSDLALARRIELDLRRLYRRTVNVIEHHRPAVLAVAEALLGRFTLSGDDVARIVFEVDTARPKGKITKSPPGVR